MGAKKCAGGFPGPCDNEPGTPWTPLWCLPCDEKRRASILKSLHEIRDALQPPDAPAPQREELNDADD